MPLVMQLEGLPQNVIDIRRQLDTGGRSRSLHGIFDPVKAHPLWAIGGVILGAWLAGSAKGQQLVSKVTKR